MKKKFNYIIVIVILFIPFIYSFFYLKAYWDPYGSGNIDNLPVAIINEDTGESGEELINSVTSSKKLKIEVVDNDTALEGLYNKKYYAVINIPKDFTSSLNSAKEENKKHATITYSPNQKSNYLASQIVNNVVANVEKELDNELNSKIVDSLTDTIKTSTDKLATINDGMESLDNGIQKLQSGGKEIQNGIDNLQKNYIKFNEGLKEYNDAVNKLEKSTNKAFENDDISKLQNSIYTINESSNIYNNNFSNYINSINYTLSNVNNLANIIVNTTCIKVDNNALDVTEYDKNACLIAKNLLSNNIEYNNNNALDYLIASGNLLEENYTKINDGINQISNKVDNLEKLSTGINTLKTNIKLLGNKTNILYINSNLIKDGINEINNGINSLNMGFNTLSNSIITAEDSINNSINNTKSEVTKLEGLSEYSNNPILVDTTTVNEVSSYGSAFSPFFISIGLWVGCLMFYVILYFDKEDRFKRLSISSKNYIQRTLLYHLLASVSAIILAILLHLLLDLNITNMALYYISIILIANTFVAIMEFLIVNFKDIGKFIALILLVLQLAASGGTFPIEVVTKSFRWLHPYLPMSYTIDLLKESLVTIDNSLVTHNFIIVFIIFIVLFIINIVNDIIKYKK